MPERVVQLSAEVSRITHERVAEIQEVMQRTRLLAINAKIEAAHAGTKGSGFAVVASEVNEVSREIHHISDSLVNQLAARLQDLNDLGRQLVEQVRGTRLADLALNAVDIIDRNLYERSCDVRWWATDSPVVQACAEPTSENCTYASQRLGVILESYTVYLDLWIADLDGKVIAHGRPDRYAGVIGRNVAKESWFRNALETANGGEFAVDDITAAPALDNRLVATYSTAVREHGEAKGEPIGVLGIFFDWEEQAQGVVNGVRLTDDERDRTRCLLVDSNHRVLAASDRVGVLTETLDLPPQDEATIGYVSADDGTVTGYALTPGYETYRGLGWYGVVIQRPKEAR